MDTSTTQVETVKQYIIGEIRSGNTNKNGLLPSMRNLASQLGVTHNSAWKAFKELKEEKYVINKGKRYQIHPTHHQSSETTLNIAFEAYGIDSIKIAFIRKLFDNLKSKELEHNLRIHQLLQKDESPYDPETPPNTHLTLLSSGPGLAAAERLRKNNMPCCALFPPFEKQFPCSIQLDNFNGGELAAKYLISKGADQACILGESLYYPDNWHESFALRSYGFCTEWIKGGNTTKSINEKPLPTDIFDQIEYIKEITNKHTKGISYFCLSDSIAILLKKAFQKKNIENPLIVGFDNLDETSSLNIPSIDHDIDSISMEIIKLARVVETEGAQYSTTIYSKPSLQIP
jgi:DNA-binding transcriptional regulator YhcF (GntR family)